MHENLEKLLLAAVNTRIWNKFDMSEKYKVSVV